MESLLKSNDMLLAINGFLPLKIQNQIYMMSIKGAVWDEGALKAVLNGQAVDTSEAVENGKVKIIDV